jgi:hypothetical protein
MSSRHILPALAAAAVIALPASLAFASGAPVTPTAARPATGDADLAAVAAADRATRVVVARLAHGDAVDAVLRLSRTRDRLTPGRAVHAASRRVLAQWSTPRLRAHGAQLRRTVRDLRRSGGAPDVAIPAALHAIAQCESGGDPAAVDASGTYRGLFQFDRGTWASVGGSGDPAAAPALEQYRRAAMLYARSGASPWPVCGR